LQVDHAGVVQLPPTAMSLLARIIQHLGLPDAEIERN
jgi:hypothetical protein